MLLGSESFSSTPSAGVINENIKVSLKMDLWNTPLASFFRCNSFFK